MKRKKWSWSIKVLLACAVYVVAGRLGIALMRVPPGNITLLWLPAGIALLGLRAFGKAFLPFIWLSSWWVNTSFIFSAMREEPLYAVLVASAISATADTIQPLVSYYFLNRFEGRHGRQILSKPLDISYFFLLICLIPSALLAVILVGNQYAFGLVTQSALPAQLSYLLISDTSGIFLVFSFALLLERQDKRIGFRNAATVALTIGAVIFVSWRWLPSVIFITFPIGILYTIRYKSQGVLVSVLSTSGLIFLGARIGLGIPYATNEAEVYFSILLFILSFAMTLLYVALTAEALASHAVTLEREVKKRTKALNKLAMTDPLTGVYNRRMFETKVEAAVASFDRGCLALIDIDYFKTYNDTYGHQIGDAILKKLAEQLMGAIDSGDLVARWGGEEFILYFSGVGLKEGTASAERLRGDVASTVFKCDDYAIRFTISIGVSRVNAKEPDWFDKALSRADDALYMSKKSGRNRVTASTDL